MNKFAITINVIIFFTITVLLFNNGYVLLSMLSTALAWIIPLLYNKFILCKKK